MKKIFIILLIMINASLLTGCKNGSTDVNTFNILHNWDKVEMKNHLNSGSNIGPLNWFSIEGLFQYVRSTDEVYYILAESIVHNDDSTSVVHLRPESKWHNGDDYTADDMIGYYYINQGEVTNYMQALNKIDDKTVEIVWKSSMEPNDNVKTLLLSIDRVGSVSYNEFKVFVNEAKRILDSSNDMPEGFTGWAPFGKLATSSNGTDYLANYTAFKSYNPDWFVATGPYKLKKVTATEMLLERNEEYWAVENLEFEFIKATNSMSDLNQIYNMLQSGEIDYQDGLAPEDTLNQILENNPDMAHYKMFDPGAIGIVFNMSKTVTIDGQVQQIFSDKVREAFQYIFERETIKNAANPYAVTSYYPLLTMAPSEAQNFMSEAAFSSIKEYSHNTQKAEELLIEAGWIKTGGKWYYSDGETLVSFKLHYDGSHPGMSGAAVAAQAQLSLFGIDCSLKKAADFNSWVGTATSEAWSHEMSLTWTDLNMSISYPTGSFVYAYKDLTAKIMQLPTYPSFGEEGYLEVNENDYGKIKLELNKYGEEGTFRVIDVTEGMYRLSDSELRDVVDDLVYGISEKNYGIQFYQNVTGSFINVGKIGGVPYEDLLSTNRNILMVPTKENDLENFYAVARLNFHFAYAVPFIARDLYPR